MNKDRFSASMKAWLEEVVRSQSELVVSPRGDELPRFPPESLQIATTGRSGSDAIQQAALFYEDALLGISRCNAVIGENWKLLDFGCGWGRITRMALRDFRLPNIMGIDVDEDFVNLCNELFSSPIFKVCQPFPPVDIASNSVQLILSYSVFSHLSENAARSWLAEFVRILQPGHYLALTTRPLEFIDYCEHLAKSRDAIVAEQYQDCLAALFPAEEVDACRRGYAEGEFIFKGIGGGGVRDGSFYGEALMPVAWIEREFRHDLEVILAEYHPERYDQLIIVLRKNER